MNESANTQPRGEQMLTDAEIQTLAEQCLERDMPRERVKSGLPCFNADGYNLLRFARAVLAKVAAQQREPVANEWRTLCLKYDAQRMLFRDLLKLTAGKLAAVAHVGGIDKEAEDIVRQAREALASPPTVPVERMREALSDLADRYDEICRAKDPSYGLDDDALTKARAALAVPQEAQRREFTMGGINFVATPEAQGSEPLPPSPSGYADEHHLFGQLKLASRGADAVQGEPSEVHTDDLAVDKFAARMKWKLARARQRGRSGWEDRAWTPEQVSEALREHVDKGDPTDVANYCMFLAARNEPIYPSPVRASGMVLAPVEPTQAMITAGSESQQYDWRRGAVPLASNIYRAMLAAAPSLTGGEHHGL